MGKATAQLRIERPADVVWSAVGDFGDLGWYGNVESCEVEGDIRHVRMQGSGLEADEVLFHRDENARSFAYGVVALRGDTKVVQRDGTSVDVGAMVGNHRATITVTPETDTACTVTYDLELDDSADELLPMTSLNYQAKLDRLKRHCEA
jgi:hypothetical protein